MRNIKLFEQSNNEFTLIHRPSYVYDKIQSNGKSYYPHQINLMGQVYFVYTPKREKMGINERINTRSDLKRHLYS